MKKILLCTIIAVLTICGLYAQNVKFGIKGGLNLPNIMAGGNNTPVSEGYKSRLAPGWGVFTELQYNTMVSFRLGVEYSGMGGKKNGMQAMPTERLITAIGNNIGMQITEEQIIGLMTIARVLPQYYYAEIDNTVKFDYVMIPLLTQFGWDIGQTPWRVYANAGPFVSFFLSGIQASKGTSMMYNERGETIWSTLDQNIRDYATSEFPALAQTLSQPVTFGENNITGEMKSANFGPTGNIGIRYQHNRNFFFLEIGGNYGFIPVQNSDVNGSNRLGAASMMLGYAFSLF